MKSLIPASWYADAGRYTHEMEALRGAWHFAGLNTSLRRNGDWIMVKVVDREVVVHNFDGELRAFTNTCTHRFNAIRNEERGNGPLTCGYHRWTFDRDGVPVGIPFRDKKLSLPLAELRLEAWQLERCGDLLFVSAQRNGPSLAEWLGGLVPRLREISSALGECYGTFSLQVQANWKLVVQNTLEFDHVHSVHPETFGPLTPARPVIEQLAAPLPHVAYRSSLAIEMPRRTIEKRMAELLARSPLGGFDGHDHISLFPLTTVGVFRGQSFSFLRYVPLGANSTSIETSLFLPKLSGLQAHERVMLSAYGTFMLDFAKKLADEDRDICESVQRGAANLPYRFGMLTEGEHAVRAFQEGYRSYFAEHA